MILLLWFIVFVLLVLIERKTKIVQRLFTSLDKGDVVTIFLIWPLTLIAIIIVFIFAIVVITGECIGWLLGKLL